MTRASRGSRPDDGPRVGDDRAHEAGEAAPDLGHRDADLALGRLDPARSAAVAGAHGLGHPLVAGAAQEDRQLVLDGPLDDELGAQAPDPAQLLGTADAAEQHLLDGFLDPGARGYPSFHGVGLLCGSATSALDPTPSSLFQRSQDATHRPHRDPTPGLGRARRAEPRLGPPTTGEFSERRGEQGVRPVVSCPSSRCASATLDSQ